MAAKVAAILPIVHDKNQVVSRLHGYGVFVPFHNAGRATKAA
jgi:hypothetical protein